METETDGPAARRWREALAGWGIPQAILDAAPASPWHFPPELFAHRAAQAVEEPLRPSHRRALEVLPEGGTVLDVGVGGGAASLPLAPPAGMIVGVDSGEGMLDAFALAADRRGVAHQEVDGRWPDVAKQVAPADVVVCSHVFYNVADLVPFAAALTHHARRRVVVELTAEHPTANLNPLWQAFHAIDRPTSPTADDAAAVLVEMGIDVRSEPFDWPWHRPTDDKAQMVMMLRRRLCVGPERDPEILAFLDAQADGPPRRHAALWWDGSA